MKAINRSRLSLTLDILNKKDKIILNPLASVEITTQTDIKNLNQIKEHLQFVKSEDVPQPAATDTKVVRKRKRII